MPAGFAHPATFRPHPRPQNPNNFISVASHRLSVPLLEDHTDWLAAGLPGTNATNRLNHVRVSSISFMSTSSAIRNSKAEWPQTDRTWLPTGRSGGGSLATRPGPRTKRYFLHLYLHFLRSFRRTLMYARAAAVNSIVSGRKERKLLGLSGAETSGPSGTLCMWSYCLLVRFSKELCEGT